MKSTYFLYFLYSNTLGNVTIGRCGSITQCLFQNFCSWFFQNSNQNSTSTHFTMQKIYCLVTWFATVWQLKVKVKPFYTMFPSYQIAMAPFQFLYQIGLLFPLEHIFFSMILLTERGCNAPILKVIQDVSDQIAIDSLQKPNGNTSGTIIGYDFEFIWKQKTYEIINEIFFMKV